ncbi:MAG TPA: hypothetical protein VF903_02820 [Nitrospirota bacterium]
MPGKRDWSKIEVGSKVLAAIGAVMLPVILLYLGNKFTEEQNNAKRATDMIQFLSSDNLQQRRMAIEATQFLTRNNQLPEELMPVLLDIAMNDPDKGVSRGAVQSLKKVAEKNRKLAPSIQKTLSALPKRVYIQIANEGQRERAKSIQIELYKKGLFVPGIEIVGGNAERSDHASILYFDPDDKSTAEMIEKALKSKGVTAVDLSYLPDMRAKAGTVEVWFAERVTPFGGFDSGAFQSDAFQSGLFGDTLFGDQ